MTRANLQSLRKNTALPHTLNYDQLARYHVPFDELTGETTVEAELALADLWRKLEDDPARRTELQMFAVGLGVPQDLVNPG